MLRIGLNSLKKEDYPNPKTHEKVYSFFAFFSSTAFGRGKLLLMNFSNYNGKAPLKLRPLFFPLVMHVLFPLTYIPQESVQNVFLAVNVLSDKIVSLILNSSLLVNEILLTHYKQR